MFFYAVPLVLSEEMIGGLLGRLSAVLSKFRHAALMDTAFADDTLARAAVHVDASLVVQEGQSRCLRKEHVLPRGHLQITGSIGAINLGPTVHQVPGQRKVGT